MLLFLALLLAVPPSYDADALAAIAIAKAKRDRLHATPEVVAKPTFQQFGYHAGHNCPTCGRSQYVIASGQKNGQHVHTCPWDGTSWTH